MNPDLPTSAALKTLSEAFPGKSVCIGIQHWLFLGTNDQFRYRASLVIGERCFAGSGDTPEQAIARCIEDHAAFDPFKDEREKLEAAVYIVTKP